MSTQSKRLRDYADSVATFAPQIAIDLFTEAADALEAAEQPESDPVANIDLAWHPCNPSTDELQKAFEEVKKLTSAVSRLDYVRAKNRGVKPMNEHDEFREWWEGIRNQFGLPQTGEPPKSPRMAWDAGRAAMADALEAVVRDREMLQAEVDRLQKRDDGVKPMNELIERLRAMYGDRLITMPLDAIGLIHDAADALETADTRHDDDVRAHALLEQVIVRRDAEISRLREALKKNVDAIGVWMTSEVELKDKMKQEAADWAETDTQIRKAAATVLGDKVHGDSEFVPHAADEVDMLVAEVKRLRKIEDASAGVMLNLELARAEVRRLLVQLKGEVAELLERIRLKDGALAVAIAHLALNDGGEE